MMSLEMYMSYERRFLRLFLSKPNKAVGITSHPDDIVQAVLAGCGSLDSSREEFIARAMAYLDLFHHQCCESLEQWRRDQPSLVGYQSEEIELAILDLRTSREGIDMSVFERLAAAHWDAAHDVTFA